MKFISLLVAAATVVCSWLVLQRPACAENEWSFYGGHAYTLTDGFGTWERSRDEANSLGGHLVTINTEEENTELVTMFPDAFEPFLWTGLYQDHEDPAYQEPDGGWKWESGEPVTFAGWHGNEPNNQPPGEDYAVLESNGEWNDWGPDQDDFQGIQGIVEYAYDWKEWGGHRYALTARYGTWEESEVEAQAIRINPEYPVGGEERPHLVSINTEAENAWLVGAFADAFTTEDPFLWTGFFQDRQDPAYQEPDGGWKWAKENEDVTFTGWHGLEPNNQLPGEDYGVLEFNGEWNDWGPDKGDFVPIRGIIEIPEPATISLLLFAGLCLGALHFRRRKTAE